MLTSYNAFINSSHSSSLGSGAGRGIKSPFVLLTFSLVSSAIIQSVSTSFIMQDQ